MSVDRMEQGMALCKNGKVHVDVATPTHVKTYVEGSNGKYYDVEMLETHWTCTCEDFMFRQDADYGAFLCKHMFGSIFKVGFMNLIK